MKWPTKPLFFDPIDPISIIGSFAVYQLETNTNLIHEEAAMWVLPFFVKNSLTTTYSRILYTIGQLLK